MSFIISYPLLISLSLSLSLSHSLTHTHSLSSLCDYVYKFKKKIVDFYQNYLLEKYGKTNPIELVTFLQFLLTSRLGMKKLSENKDGQQVILSLFNHSNPDVQFVSLIVFSTILQHKAIAVKFSKNMNLIEILHERIKETVGVYETQQQEEAEEELQEQQIIIRKSINNNKSFEDAGSATAEEEEGQQQTKTMTTIDKAITNNNDQQHQQKMRISFSSILKDSIVRYEPESINNNNNIKSDNNIKEEEDEDFITHNNGSRHNGSSNNNNNNNNNNNVNLYDNVERIRRKAKERQQTKQFLYFYSVILKHLCSYPELSNEIIANGHLEMFSLLNSVAVRNKNDKKEKNYNNNNNNNNNNGIPSSDAVAISVNSGGATAAAAASNSNSSSSSSSNKKIHQELVKAAYQLFLKQANMMVSVQQEAAEILNINNNNNNNNVMSTNNGESPMKVDLNQQQQQQKSNIIENQQQHQRLQPMLWKHFQYHPDDEEMLKNILSSSSSSSSSIPLERDAIQILTQMKHLQQTQFISNKYPLQNITTSPQSSSSSSSSSFSVGMKNLLNLLSRRDTTLSKTTRAMTILSSSAIAFFCSSIGFLVRAGFILKSPNITPSLIMRAALRSTAVVFLYSTAGELRQMGLRKLEEVEEQHQESKGSIRSAIGGSLEIMWYFMRVPVMLWMMRSYSFTVLPIWIVNMIGSIEPPEPIAKMVDQHFKKQMII